MKSKRERGNEDIQTLHGPLHYSYPIPCISIHPSIHPSHLQLPPQTPSLPSVPPSLPHAQANAGLGSWHPSRTAAWDPDQRPIRQVSPCPSEPERTASSTPRAPTGIGSLAGLAGRWWRKQTFTPVGERTADWGWMHRWNFVSTATSTSFTLCVYREKEKKGNPERYRMHFCFLPVVSITTILMLPHS